jgi:pyridinium-3,5-bisthiocarboxylic acid mononucleotide nickel chelatase
MSLAWLQCQAGASGDMLLGALVDAGAPLAHVQRALDAIRVERVVVSASEVDRAGLAATRIDLKVTRSTVVRTWANVRAVLESAELPAVVRARSVDVFARLARAEARVHRTTPEQARFHDVGALEALAYVVGVCAALDAMEVTAVHATPVALGQGMVRSEHGLLPIPVPMVVALLSEAGAPVYSGDLPYEMCTPTGAALLASLVGQWGGLPPMRVTATGAGAGSRDLEELPNVLRVMIGEPA